MKNPFGKTTSQSEPYAIYKNEMAGWEWRVLKTYQRPDKERSNPYARWFLATKSPYTYGSYELGDGYSKEILDDPQTYLVSANREWRDHYGS
jgi:hypothetical protein